MTTKQFDVSIEDRPGNITHVASVLAKSNVNIRAASTDEGPESSVLHLIVDNDASTRKALNDAKIEFSERDITIVILSHKAGEPVKVTDRHSSKELDVESLFAREGRHNSDDIAIIVDRWSEAEKSMLP